MPNGQRSIVGLRQHHRDKESATQDALVKAYEQLERDQPQRPWTRTELWRMAGLKSGNALRNPRHLDVLEQFEAHNRDVRDAVERGRLRLARSDPDNDRARSLRHKLAEMQAQLDKACSLNAVYQREARYYRQQHEDVAIRLERVLRERDDWKQKFFAGGTGQSGGGVAIASKEDVLNAPSAAGARHS
jgi:hypothetical protein